MADSLHSLYLPESDTTEASGSAGSSGAENQRPRRQRKTFVQWLQEQPHGESLLVTIPPAFLDDDFNLVDIEEQLPEEFREQVDDLLVIVQGRAPSDWQLRDEHTRCLLFGAGLLYCVVHQRYLQTRPGQQAMEAIIEGAGRVPCRRVLCEGSAMLPMGEGSCAGSGPVRFWCPSCQEAYAVGSPSSVTLDGAAFGPSFPLLYLLSYKGRTVRDIQAQSWRGRRRLSGNAGISLITSNMAPPPRVYEPRIFGFRVRPGGPTYKGHHISLVSPRDR
jgi:hypothetical protein